MKNVNIIQFFFLLEGRHSRHKCERAGANSGGGGNEEGGLAYIFWVLNCACDILDNFYSYMQYSYLKLVYLYSIYIYIYYFQHCYHISWSSCLNWRVVLVYLSIYLLFSALLSHRLEQLFKLESSLSISIFYIYTSSIFSTVITSAGAVV